MNLHIRDFPDEVGRKLKHEAVDRHLSLRDLVIERCSVSMKSGEERMSLKRSSSTTKKASVPPTSPVSSVMPFTDGAEKKRPSLAELVSSGISDSNISRHDSATCRTYGCGLCRAEGVRDKFRGL